MAGEAGGAVVSHYTIGDTGGRLTYALDLDVLFSSMGSPERQQLIREAAQARRPTLDALETRIREGLTEAALADGDPPPTFERQDDHLFVTAEVQP